MKKNILLILLAPVVFAVGLLVLSPYAVDAKTGPDYHKIAICHATSSVKNPYNLLNVDKNSTAGGHDIHSGDIIPPFTYSVWEKVGSHMDCPSSNSAYGSWASGKTCWKWIGGHQKFAYPVRVDDYDWVEHTYAGKNWDSDGQAIWNNGCVVPSCLHTSENPGDWSDWSLDETDTTQELRTRTVSLVDSSDSSVSCGSKTETEYRDTPVCKYTTTVTGDWSEWVIDNENPFVLVRKRTISSVDINDETYVCSSETEKESRPVDVCTYTTTVTGGEWSDWSVDPSDSSKELRTRSVSLVDSSDNTYVCSLDTETEYRNVENNKDDQGEVLGESTVVLAETGPSSNVWVYVVESILLVLTTISFVFFSKEYLKKSA